MHSCRHRLGPDQRQPSSGPAPPPVPRTPRHAAPHPCFALLPAPLGLRFRALLGLGFVPPPEPRPCAHCASIAYALLPAARVPLCRHRADPESSSRSLPSGSPARIAPPIAPTARRRSHRAHRAPTSASPPPSLSSRCGGPRALAGKNRAVCIPFSPNARKRPSSWQHPPEMHALRDQDGNILAPCIHSRAQSGDSGYMARESCRQGPFFASRNPKSRMARRCCQRRTAFPRQRPAVRPNGLCALRCGPGLLAACAPPAVLLVSAVACASPPSRPRSSPPSYTRRASPSETRHAVPVPMHLAICAPHPSRQPRGPTASRKQAEQRKQLNAGIKIGSPNGDPIEEFFGFAQRLPDALQPLHQANELALSYLDHSTRQRLRGYVIGLSGNSFTVDLYAALVDHATSIAR